MSVPQECPTRVPCKSVPRSDESVAHESVPRERSTRVSPTRVSKMFGRFFSSTCLHYCSWAPYCFANVKVYTNRELLSSCADCYAWGVGVV